MSNRILIDPDSDIVEEHYAIVFALRRNRGRFPEASVEIVDSEAAARKGANPGNNRFAARDVSNLFARKRLGYSCLCEKVEKDSGRGKRILAKFETRFGKFVQTLRAFPDFSLFRLQPASGSYICGFGKAYKLEGDNLQQVSRITPENLKSAS